jgi:hypothetical protein
MRKLLACLLLALAIHASAADDHRAWQHGVNLVKVGEKLLLVWGSAGNPPRPNLGGDWPHDIYYAWLDAKDPTAVSPQVLVSLPEAQEPPSVAVNDRGTILVTSEDGNGGINQNAGLWDGSLRALRKYPFLVRRGGHSGHVAALRDRFLVAYGEGWVEGGGFLNRGTGKDIYARIVENDGTLRKETRIAAGHRDGWPLVAASDRNWLVVWQRYPQLTLHIAAVSAEGKVGKERRIIEAMPVRYAYDVAFAPQLGAYVVAGSTVDGGFAALVSREGELIALQRGLPPMASESRLVIGDDAQPMAVYPVNPRGIAVLRLSAGAIELAKVVDHPHSWDYMGTAGRFLDPGRVLFATLSKTGLRLFPINLRD